MRTTKLSKKKVTIDSYCKAFIPCHVAFTFHMPVMMSMQRKNMLIKFMLFYQSSLQCDQFVLFLFEFFCSQFVSPKGVFTSLRLSVIFCTISLSLNFWLHKKHLSSNSRIKSAASELSEKGVLNLKYFGTYC